MVNNTGGPAFPTDNYGGWKEQTITFFLDGDVRQFDTLEDVYVAYMEKVCGFKEQP